MSTTGTSKHLLLQRVMDKPVSPFPQLPDHRSLRHFKEKTITPASPTVKDPPGITSPEVAPCGKLSVTFLTGGNGGTALKGSGPQGCGCQAGMNVKKKQPKIALIFGCFRVFRRDFAGGAPCPYAFPWTTAALACPVRVTLTFRMMLFVVERAPP